jgi:hypothetical protein
MERVGGVASRLAPRATPCVLTMAKEKKLRKGPRTNDSGATQASVSDSAIDGNETDAIDFVDAIIEAGSRSVAARSPSIVQSGDARRGGSAGDLRAVSDDGGEFVDAVVVNRSVRWTGEKQAQ